MKATLQIELQPFQTPNFVRAVGNPGLKQDGMQELPCYPLSDLDANTLDKLCSEFRDEVFRKAGKEQPLTCVMLTPPNAGGNATERSEGRVYHNVGRL